jgi:hypothetical protein
MFTLKWNPILVRSTVQHCFSSWPGIAVRRTASLPLARRFRSPMDPAIHVLLAELP